MDNASARNMWGDYLEAHLEDAFKEAPKTIHFCDNEEDANSCADLVRSGVKTTTSHSLLGLQYQKERLPRIGDFIVVTDWEGTAKCIVKTTKVKLIPYFSIDSEYAQTEALGDKSLAYWRNKYWADITKELEPFERVPRDSMIIICQEFEKVFER